MKRSSVSISEALQCRHGWCSHTPYMWDSVTTCGGRPHTNPSGSNTCERITWKGGVCTTYNGHTAGSKKSHVKENKQKTEPLYKQLSFFCLFLPFFFFFSLSPMGSTAVWPYHIIFPAKPRERCGDHPYLDWRSTLLAFLCSLSVLRWHPSGSTCTFTRTYVHRLLPAAKKLIFYFRYCASAKALSTFDISTGELLRSCKIPRVCELGIEHVCIRSLYPPL